MSQSRFVSFHFLGNRTTETMAQLDGDQLALVSPSNGAVTANEENKAGVAVGSLLRRYYALFFSRQRSDGAARNQTDGPREPPSKLDAPQVQNRPGFNWTPGTGPRIMFSPRAVTGPQGGPDQENGKRNPGPTRP